ncbi:DUF308 domain-containing protein [Falsirhodobacter sp. alg1]|uniref:DUF308 domain-containing protein n=1 Tax=Falsirhodobacter sp. alg1 TaxID=1472418 RepID=UPI00192D0A1F|nr:DUF308 domain-containing protein [Falsirhodobacter sp. alg1]
MMKSWVQMTAAGIVALVGGLFALVNPLAASMTTVTLVGWALVIVAVLQGWATYSSATMGLRIRAGVIALAAAFLGLSLLLGPFGDGTLFKWLVGLLLLGSGAAKLYAGFAMKGVQNQPLVYGAGAVSIVLGAVVLFGLNLNFGILLGIELLASGLGLVLLGLYRKSQNV